MVNFILCIILPHTHTQQVANLEKGKVLIYIKGGKILKPKIEENFPKIRDLKQCKEKAQHISEKINLKKLRVRQTLLEYVDVMQEEKNPLDI